MIPAKLPARNPSEHYIVFTGNNHAWTCKCGEELDRPRFTAHVTQIYNEWKDKDNGPADDTEPVPSICRITPKPTE